MFIVSVTYLKPLDQIDLHLAAHRDFLGEQYRRGVFLMSGRRVPRDGGIIIADGLARAELEQLVTTDPFHVAGVARYDITEFVPTMTADALAALRRD
jgi:uncharacterized protein YciI